MRRVFAKALSAVLILNCGILGPAALAARFVDLDGNWAEKYVNKLSDEGVIGAEPDGKFRPDAPVTRAVLSAWLVKTLGLDNQDVPNKSDFADVQTTDWFFKPVELITKNNLIAAYTDGFRPNQNIQRGEVIAIIARALHTTPPSPDKVASILAKYKDGAQVPDWARTGVAEAADACVLVNHPDDNIINAASIAKRADTAALVYQLDQYLTQQKISSAEKAVESGPPAVAQSPPAYTPYNAPPQQGAPNYNQTYANPAAGYPPAAAAAAAPPYGAPGPAGYNAAAAAAGGYAGGAYGAAPGGYGAPGGYPPQTGYAQGAYPPPQYGQPGAYPGGAGYLQGRVAVVAAGTQFQANLTNTLDSGSTQPGEEVRATLGSPLYSNGVEVVPAGSKLIGQVTNVVSAKRFRFGANGKIDVRFTQLETPDGRRFPLSASVNSNQIKLTGGSTAGRVGKSLLFTGGGAAGGAALGTGLGAIVGGLSHSSSMGMATGMGAAFGAAMGGGVGLVGAGVRKGSEVKLVAGTSMPIQLDESLQITAGGPPVQQPYYGGGGGNYGGGYGGGNYPPAVQQPAMGGYYPPQ